MKKTIFTSVLALVVCLSMLVGATFALFTSESTTNITVSSGTVNVDADITLESVYSPTTLNGDGVVVDGNNAAIDTNTFYNKGTVTVEDGEIILSNMTPGDKAFFKVTMTNNSNVDFMQRMLMNCTNEDQAFFGELLFGISDTVDGTYTYYSNLTTAWESNAAVYGDTTEAVRYISIEMPGHVADKWQGKTCNVAVNVMAVQGNTEVVDGESSVVYMVEDQATLNTAVASAKDGDTIYVTAPVAGELTLTTDAEMNLTVRGYAIETLTVNAANATIHVYNDIETLNGNAIAHHSLYVYGLVNAMAVYVGRVVVAADAVVETLHVKAAEGEKVTVDVPAVTSVIKEIIVDSKASSEVQVNVSKAVENAPVVEEAETNEGALTEVKFDKNPAGLQDLLIALATANDGDVIVLSQNIVIDTIANGVSGNQTPIISIKKSITLDMNGMTISVSAKAAEKSIVGVPVLLSVENNANVVLKNGTVNAEAGNNGCYAIGLNGGNLTIESGHYYGAPTAVQVTTGNLTIMGGTFEMAPTCESSAPAMVKYLINCADANYANGTATVAVTGGSFKGFNPADNASEGANTNFLGMSSLSKTEDNVWYTVEKANDYVKNEEAKTIEIGTATGLAQLATEVNSGITYSGWTVTLIADIDLENKEWTPIGKGQTNSFRGVFDGQNHIIYNLNARTTSGWYCGLFGYVRWIEGNPIAAVRNFTIENATVIGGHSTGIVIGESFCADVENVTVKGNVTVVGDAYVGGIVGRGYSSIKNCHILANEGGTITANSSYTGGIIGHRGEGSSYDINGCTVKNMTLNGFSVMGGIAGISQTGNKITNCVLENVTLVYHDSTDPTGIGAISGWSCNDVSITGCTFTGTIDTSCTLYHDMVTGLGNNGAAQSGLVLENNKVTATVVAE